MLLSQFPLSDFSTDSKRDAPFYCIAYDYRSHMALELQDFEQSVDAIFYTEVLNAEVALKMFFSTKHSSASTWKTKILYFHILQITSCSK